MQPELLYISYTTSFHEQTGDIITFAQFEEGILLENERNLEEDVSTLAQLKSLIQMIIMMQILEVQAIWLHICTPPITSICLVLDDLMVM